MEAWVVLAAYAVYAVPVGIYAARMVFRSGVEVEDRYQHTLREAGLPAEGADPEDGDGPVRRVLRKASFSPHSLFINRTKLTTLQRVAFSIGALILLPVRLILFPLFLGLAAVLARLAVAGLPRSQALTSWPRLAVREVMCLMIRAAVLSLGLWVRTRGRRASKEEAPLIVANHYAFFDADLPPRLRAAPLSAKKNEQIPFVAAIMQCLQAVIVDRSSPASRAAATDRMRDAALDPRRPQIVIFPEGSTTNRAALCRFKPGAFLPLQPVQPVLTDFSAGPVDGSWTHEGATLGRTMVLLASRPVSWITYTFLPPVLPPASPVGAPTPDVETGSDSANRSLVADSPDSQQWMGDAARREAAEAFAERVRVTMADAGQLPLSNVLFDDVLMLDRAKRLRFPPSACLVELLSLRPHVRVRTRFAIACVSHFVMLSRGRLHVDEESFRERAPLPNLLPHERDRLFAAMDAANSGLVSFHSFLVGLCLLRDATPERAERCASLLFDVIADGAVPGKAEEEPCVSTSRALDLLHAASKQQQEQQQQAVEDERSAKVNGPLTAAPDLAASMPRREFVAWALGGVTAEAQTEPPVVALAAAAGFTPPPRSHADVLAARHPDAVDIGMPKGSASRRRRRESSFRVAPGGR